MPEAQSTKQVQVKETTAAETSLLDQIVQQAPAGAEPAALERRRDLVKEFIGQVLQGEMTVSR
ncbi:MAG TPA: type VI secretion system contractile sheath large subunit, partial [Bryobacteraceae bacterium]|nr:type VI secretion system contractile sheath large subunit [Bryobacteraceae bacterium]